MTDNLNAEPTEDTILTTISEQIRAGNTTKSKSPRVTTKPSQASCTENPSLARSHYRKFPPVTQRIMDQIDGIQDPETIGGNAESPRPRTTSGQCLSRAREQQHSTPEPTRRH